MPGRPHLPTLALPTIAPTCRRLPAHTRLAISCHSLPPRTAVWHASSLGFRGSTFQTGWSRYGNDAPRQLGRRNKSGTLTSMVHALPSLASYRWRSKRRHLARRRSMLKTDSTQRTSATALESDGSYAGPPTRPVPDCTTGLLPYRCGRPSSLRCCRPRTLVPCSTPASYPGREVQSLSHAGLPVWASDELLQTAERSASSTR